jgi:DNA-binding beta-propeller fold protein YncE
MGAEVAIGRGGSGREHATDIAARRILAFALTLAPALAAALAWATPSLAARGHEFAGAFGWGVVNGASELQRCKGQLPQTPPVCQPGLSGNGPGQFDNPDGVAVNEASGDVYVVDKNNNRVEIFNASGEEFVGEFNGSGLLPNEGKAAGSGGGPEEVATGQFDEPEEIAVDNSCVLRHIFEPRCKEEDPSDGDVYVVDTNGHKVGTLEEERKVIDKYSAGGEYIGQITRNPGGEFSELGFQKVHGVAVDPRGEVWVEEENFGSSPHGAANYTNALINAWIGFRTTETSALVSAAGFAVDSEDNLYVHGVFPAGSFDRLAKFTPNGELLTREVDEEVPAGVAVEPTSDDVYVAHASNVHRLDPAGVSLERLQASGASFSGVAVNSSTLTVYVADPGQNRVDVFAPEAPGRPTVQADSSSVSDVTATSASFSAEVNPRSEPNEQATSYSFQYGPCTSPTTCKSSPYPQSIPVPEGTLAPNYEPDLVNAHPQDLSAHTLYHVRVVAHNSHGSVEGEEQTFTTQGAASAGLPDGREWELVSPPDKRGAILLPIEETGVIQAAAAGDAISYLANAPSEAQPQGFSQVVQILSRRAPSGWQSEDIATPHEATVGISVGGGQGEYRFFSEDLASAIVQPFGPFTKALSPQGSEQTPYLRVDFAPGDPSQPCSSSCYRPLVTGCPEEGEPCPGPVQEAADVPAGTKFSETAFGEGGTCKEECAPYFLGASADASHVVLSSAAALTPGASEGGVKGSLYEWAGGRLALVSVLPNDQPVAPATRPGLGFAPENEGLRIARQAISTDGSRVIWSAGELNGAKQPTGNHHLYLRDTAAGKEQTIKLDSPEAACTTQGKCKATAAPVFQTASTDDSRIFFTDSQPLTRASGDSDLYECQIEESEEEQLFCKLSDLTPPGAGEEGAGVLGLVAGASEDGSAIYFTANGRLAGPNARGEDAVAGDCGGETANNTLESQTAPQRCNLYARGGGQTRLVAVLSGADFADWSLRQGGLAGLTDRVSPDGRFLAFMSRRSLAGYDNRDAVSGRPDQEVFVYDSAANGGQGGLICASCDPSGGRPHGVQYKRIDVREGGLAGGFAIWPETAWIAASVPGWMGISGEGFALHQPRYLTDSGRVFFNAADSLVPQDANKTEDVYEHEPVGIGDCSSESASFDPASGGCVALISSGAAKEESALLDASQSGDDVFFLTSARLLPGQDTDQSLDVYDAHVCSGQSPCLPSPLPPPPPCEGDACQSPGQAPEDHTPGSLTFQGPGNPVPPAAPIVKHKTAAQLRAEKLKRALKACRRIKSKHRRRRCQARAHKLYGPHKAKSQKPAGKSRR